MLETVSIILKALISHWRIDLYAKGTGSDTYLRKVILTLSEALIGKSDDWKNGEDFRENKKQMKEGMVRMEELKSRDVTLLTKVCIVKAMVFLVVMYWCENWTIKKAEHWRINTFKLWCWRRLLRVLWTTRRSNQSILKEINSEYSLEGLMLKEWWELKSGDLKILGMGWWWGREGSQRWLLTFWFGVLNLVKEPLAHTKNEIL